MTRSQKLALGLPGLLVPTMVLIFTGCAAWLGREAGYLLGFAIYWLVWCLALPWLLLGPEEFGGLRKDQTPLLSRRNLVAAVLWGVISVVSVGMYAGDFVRASFGLILIALPAATINGVCEEWLWRGTYVRLFPRNPWLGILYPALGFAVWHLAPLSVFPAPGGMFPFVLSTACLGLAYGFIAYRTGSAKWTAVSHSLNGFLALSGMLGPSLLRLMLP